MSVLEQPCPPTRELPGLVVVGSELTDGGDPHRRLERRLARDSWQRRLLFASDLVAITFAWSILAVVVPGPRRLAVVLVAATSALLWLGLHGMYRVASTKSRTHESSHLYEAALLSAVVATVVASRPDLEPEPLTLLVGTLLGGLCLQAGRYGFRMSLTRGHLGGRHLRPAVLVGSSAEMRHQVQRMRAHPELGYAVVAAVEDPDPARIAEVAHASGAQTVIVVPGAFTADELARLVRRTTNSGLHVHVLGSMLGIDARRVQVRPLGRDVCIHVHRMRLDGGQAFAKRLCDLCLSLVGLLVLAPVLAVAALAVKLGDRGPILFRQERIGRDDRPFVMYKFRSMVVDAEARRAEVEASNGRSGPLFKHARDPRVTRVGRILRATSIDELPQLWNVVKGEMSIVGPRPALASEVAEFSPELRRRHTVLPGITGLWQIEGRDDPDFAVYEENDIFYVENWSVMLDLVIIWRTVGAILARVVRRFGRTTSRSRDVGVVLD